MEDLSPEETYKHKRNLYIGLSIIFIITGILLLTFAIKASAEELASQTNAGTTMNYPPDRYTPDFTVSSNTDISNGFITFYGKSPFGGATVYATLFDNGTPVNCNSVQQTPVDSSQAYLFTEIDFIDDASCALQTGHTYKFLFQSNGGHAGTMGDGTDAYFILYDEEGSTPPNTNFNSRIIWVNPPKQTPSATTTSRTIDFEFNYYLNSASSTDASKIILSLCPLSYPNDDCQKIDVGDITPDSYENISTTTTTNRDGYYLGIVSFWNGVEEATTCSWWEFWCEAEQVKIYNSVANNFNVATTSLEVELPISYEAISSQCEDGNFAEEGICKALLWLFYPSGDVLTGMEELGTTIRGKVPFGYFYQVSDKLNAIATASSTEGSNIIVHAWGDDGVEITLMDWSSAKSFYEETFGNLDGYVVMLAWLAFAGYAFFRISEII